MPQKLPYEDFLRSFELAPRLTVELIIENETHQLLLLERDIEPFIGLWHLPGGFLLKGEELDDCIKRLAQDELNITIDPIKTERLLLFENIDGDPKGHLLHYPVKIKLESLSDQNYFSQIPENTIPYQITLLKKLGYTLE